MEVGSHTYPGAPFLYMTSPISKAGFSPPLPILPCHILMETMIQPPFFGCDSFPFSSSQTWLFGKQLGLGDESFGPDHWGSNQVLFLFDFETQSLP